MTELVHVEPGRYHDSVTLMRASAAAQGIAGVDTVIAAMATDLNRQLLVDAGFPEPDASADDLVIAVRSHRDATAAEALAAVERGEIVDSKSIVGLLWTANLRRSRTLPSTR